MKENKKEILKKGLMKTDTDFTSKLMNKINAEEEALSNVLTRHGSVSTSPDFTAQLMSQLEGKSTAIPYEPAISKKAWIGIAAMSIGLVFFTLISGTENSRELGIEEGFGRVMNDVGTFFSGGSIFNYVMLGSLLLSIGLVVEQKVGKKM
jgi:hypothetical protein